MAALNFVAAEDGLEDDPKLKTLARLLKVARPLAFWFVMRLRRLILTTGNHLSGFLPKNYGSNDIAAYLEFEGAAQRLIDAMKKQGYLGYKKGRGFFYPGWSDLTTGRYACRRERDRQSKVESRKSESSAWLAVSKFLIPAADASSDRRATSSPDPTGRKKESNPELPPDPPPTGGACLADARWDWVQEHAPTPQNSRVCKAILGAMSVETWDAVQRAYSLIGQPGASISKKNSRVLNWPTDQFLRKEAYLRFLPRKRPTRTKPVTAMDTLAELERRQADGDAFLMDFLRDPDQPDAKKQQRRERWLADPVNQDRKRPWEGIPAQENGVSAHPITPPHPPSARESK